MDPKASGNYVEVTPNGQLTAIVGKFNTNIFRNNLILKGLRFEVKCPGIRLTNKAPKCSTIVKREYGLKGNPAKLLAQFEAMAVAHPELFTYANPIVRED